MKRAFDVAAAAGALAVLLPLFVLIIFIVRATSPGPAIYRQERLGLGGRTFAILKFRTMREPSALVAGPQITVDGDPRITSFGRLLRATKLDELPQLINVVRGDMSLVGPRPEVPAYAGAWTTEQRRIILSVRPGITDPASVQFRRESALLAEQDDPEAFYRSELMPMKTSLYVNYVQTRTFRGDLTILADTFRSVLTS